MSDNAIDNDPARLPPQNLEAEEYVLGAMLLSTHAVDAAGEILQPDDFYRGDTHGLIFRVCCDLHSEGRPVDAITVIDRLEEGGKLEGVGGRARLHELANIVPATANVRHYARIVKDNATLRRLASAGMVLTDLAYERPQATGALIEEAERIVYQLRTGNTDRKGFATASDAIEATVRRLHDLYEQGSEIIGVPSGLRDLDRMTSGFHNGNLFVLAARPSMGKSGLALGWCTHLSLHTGHPVALFSLEMSTDEILHRILAIDAGVDVHQLRTGRLRETGWSRVYDTAQKMRGGAPLYIEDSGSLSMLELRSKARRLKALDPTLALIVVDYLQLMVSGGNEENRVVEVGKISRGLKQLARELDVPIVALSQLSRAVESRHDKRPMLSDLRESGSIEQDADVVAFLYRDEYYNPEEFDNEGVAELHLAKHRNGPTDTVKLAFVKRYARFTDLHLAGDLSSAAPAAVPE